MSGDGVLIPFGTASEDTEGMAIVVGDFYENCGSLNEPHATIHRKDGRATYEFKDSEFEFTYQGDEQEVIGGIEILTEERWIPLPDSLHDDLNTLGPIQKRIETGRWYQLGIRIGDNEIQTSDGHRGHIISRTEYPEEVFRFPDLAIGSFSRGEQVSYLKDGDTIAVKTGSGAIFITRENTPTDIKKVIPETEWNFFRGNQKHLRDALAPFIKNKEGKVKITISDNNFEFHSTKRPEEKRARSQVVRCEYSGPDVHLFMDPKILNDMISAMFDKDVEIGHRGHAMDPIAIRFKEEGSPFFPGRSETYVAMGMRP